MINNGFESTLVQIPFVVLGSKTASILNIICLLIVKMIVLYKPCINLYLCFSKNKSLKMISFNAMAMKKSPIRERCG